MEIYLYAGIIAKFVQNGEENGQGRQVEVAGRLGAHMPCWPAPPWCRLVCQVAWPCHRSVGATPQALSSVDPMSVCTDGHDGVVLDPWVHCHGLGALQLTSKPLYLPNFDMCRLHNRLWEPTRALRSKGDEIKGRSVPYHAGQRPTFTKPP